MSRHHVLYAAWSPVDMMHEALYTADFDHVIETEADARGMWNHAASGNFPTFDVRVDSRTRRCDKCMHGRRHQRLLGQLGPSSLLVLISILSGLC